MHPAVVLLVAFVAGSVPFSWVAARLIAGVDLREHGTGTVSGTGLYEVTSKAVLVPVGILEVAKGAAGPLLAGDRPVLAAAAVALAVAGHNWSVFLGGQGGRGISPAMGALLATAWPGALVLLAGLAFGKMAGETGLGSFVAQALLVPVVAVTHGTGGALAGAAVVAVMWTKRLVGNGLPEDGGSVQVWLSRLLYDRGDRLTPEGTA